MDTRVPLIENYVNKNVQNTIGQATGKNGIIGIGRIVGPFQESEVVNRNRRRYSDGILWGAIRRDLSPSIELMNLGGALDHHDGQVTLVTASHAITSLEKDPSNPHIVLGEAVLMPTPSGEIATSLYRSKFRVGISARALGSVVNSYNTLGESNDPIEEVQPDYMMITYDLVSIPSHANAMPQLVEAKRIMEMMQGGLYKQAKNENASLTKQLADILYDTLDISESVKKSDEFQKMVKNILEVADVIADIKIEYAMNSFQQAMVNMAKTNNLN